MEDLPELVLERVISFLSDTDVLALAATCSVLRSVCQQEAVWRPRCEAFGVSLPCSTLASGGPEQPQEQERAETEAVSSAAGDLRAEAHGHVAVSPTSTQQPTAAAAAAAAASPVDLTSVDQPLSGPAAAALTYRTLYLGLLRQYGVLLTGQQPTRNVGPAAITGTSGSQAGTALWQATALPFGGLTVARFQAPGEIVLYSVIAYRLNGPVRGRPVLRITPRPPPPPLPRPLPPSPAKELPEGAAESSATEAASPAPAHEGLQTTRPGTVNAGTVAGGSTRRPAHLWHKLVGMLQGMLSNGGAGGTGPSSVGGSSIGQAAGPSTSGAGPSSSHRPSSGSPPPTPPHSGPHQAAHPPWPDHVKCCCQVHPGPDGKQQEHPAMLRILAHAAPSTGGPTIDASANSSTSSDRSGNASGRGSGSGSGSAMLGGNGGFVFHCAHSCRHTDFDPLLRHTGNLGPGVPLNLVDLPIPPHLMVPTSASLADASAYIPQLVPAMQPGSAPAPPSLGSGSAPSTATTGPLVLTPVPELDPQYARLCSVQYIQHHTRFLRRRSGDNQESKALMYRPLQGGQGHPLAGLWRGTYGFHGMEILNFALEAPPGLHPSDPGPTVGEGRIDSTMLLRGVKITGDSNVPRGQVSIEMDVSAPHPSPTTPPGQRFALPPNLQTGVEEQGPQGLENLVVQAVYRGRGHIAQTGFERDSWTTVEVVVFNNACMGIAWHELESFSMFSRLPL